MLEPEKTLQREGAGLVSSHEHRGLVLLPQRAVWRVETRTLFVADAHLGKAATFRTLGQPAPKGTTRDNLDRLDALIDRFNPTRLVFLGDLFHARQAHAPRVAASFLDWRRRHAALRLTLVRGNHDRRAGDPSEQLGIELVDEPYDAEGIVLRHHPLASDECEGQGATILAGHLHPCVRLRGAARDSVRLPCFVLQERQVVLPAFGAFTGGALVRGRDIRTCAIVDERWLVAG
ncbi:ligase-associated DNA damage response endonuclease PdeM [Methylocystis rosea]|uniref:ligase-associated DNA damage response endonuclease PdeM n=1 Tax=Methylocystis rosea TaxID=173366 RepID=UPI00035C8E9F|nr:ligase-associated DNA damage response endonuclease PdeM [Methylocystis rosea]